MSDVRDGRGHVASYVTLANLGLTAVAFAVVVAGGALGLRGGDANRAVDTLQLAVTMAYVVLTPIAAIVVFRIRQKRKRFALLNVALLATWVLALIGSTFLHL